MIELDTEALVIGSGFGGGVVASRLVDEGISVVMLERGPWRNTVPVNSMNVRVHAELPRKSFGQMIRKSLVSIYSHFWPIPRGFGINRKNGTYEVHIHQGFVSVASSQVGGGSMVYGGLIDRPLDSAFWDDVAQGVSEEILAPHFERVKSDLGVISIDGSDFAFPRDLPETMQKNSAFDLTINKNMSLAYKLPGYESKPSPYGIERKNSQMRGSLSFGCLDGSKASTDHIYVGPALAKGLKLLAHCEVNSIEKKESSGYTVYATHCDYKQPIKVHCKQLFMGAGSYNTTRLLLEAQRDKKLNPMPGLGKGIGNNGDDLTIALNATKQGSKKGRSGFLTLFTLPDSEPNITHLIANLDTPQPTSKLLRCLLGPILKSSLVAGMGPDLANGIAVLKKNRLKIAYEPGKQKINQAVAIGNRVTSKALKLFTLKYYKKPVTAHLFGGARVSEDATEGVVNGFGESHQNPNLYVVDAAAIPKAPAAAPSLNIAAWASHVAEYAIGNCDTEAPISIKTDIDRTLRRAKVKELTMLFSSLPVATEAQSPAGHWILKTLTADHRSFGGHFKLLFHEELTFDFLEPDGEIEYLRPKNSTLDLPVLANSWGGTGLVYQILTAVKGELITMQLRKLPDREAWLIHSANDGELLGWHLLAR